MKQNWPTSGPQFTVQRVCGPDESVKCGPDLGHSNFHVWARCGPVLLHFFFFYGWHSALLWLNCGPNLANRSGPPKCHHSTQYVGQMKMSSVGRFWATAILVSGPDVGQFCFICFFYGGHAALLWLNCGPNLANRSGPPKCHHSTRHVGQMNVSSVGRIWATAILVSGPDVCQFCFIIFFMADMRHCYGLIVAQIWQTGADRPSAIISRGMWARWTLWHLRQSTPVCQIWATIKP